MEDTMFYVAADPDQPGAAWGMTTIDPEYAQDTAKTVADWVKKGAIIMRVDRATGCDMLEKWVRPSKKNHAKQSELGL